jgi:16S rRNA (cytosine967-C5)-methyltransferase
MSQANPGRVAALRALVRIETGDHAEDMLAEHAPKKGPDRGLAWHLTLGVLRWQGALDLALKPFLSRPIERLDPGVRNALRLGLFEVHHSNTPTRAAVHQAVESVRAIGLGRATGIVNAVLRKASAAELSQDPRDRLPPWLYQRWSAHPDWLERMMQPARVSLAGEPPDGIEVTPAVLGSETLEDLWLLPSSLGNIAHLPGFEDGYFWVMDPSAAKVADLVAEATPAGGTVLDACAAPGGKAFRLSKAGFQVTAVDRSPERLRQMSNNLARLRMRIQLQPHDWLIGGLGSERTFDSVLVDAPCTGLGTVRRHPEIIWRREAGDPASMGVTQRQILKNAASHVKPEGTLVYSVCSTEREEGTDVAESMSGWSIEKTWSSAPPQGDEDGFQAFVLRRNAT